LAIPADEGDGKRQSCASNDSVRQFGDLIARDFLHALNHCAVQRNFYEDPSRNVQRLNES